MLTLENVRLWLEGLSLSEIGPLVESISEELHARNLTEEGEMLFAAAEQIEARWSGRRAGAGR